MTRIHEALVFEDFEENIKCFDTSNLILQPYCSISGDFANEECEIDDEMIIKYGYYSQENLPEKTCRIHE